MFQVKHLPTPFELMQKLPAPLSVEKYRLSAKNIMEGKDSRLAVLVGPCSIHDSKAAIEFAFRLKDLLPRIEKTLLPIMRLFLEKPRSRLGWKGLVYDPDLNGSHDFEKGLYVSRKLLMDIGSMGIGCSMEFLDPLVSYYLQDMISWGVVGARTAASQPHRQMASAFSFPVGFKNDLYGQLEESINGIIASRHVHAYAGLSLDGKIALLQSQGNPWTHLVLRGAKKEVNYDPASVAKAQEFLKKNKTADRVMIDCSHGNSNKNARQQIAVFQSVIEQVAKGNQKIIGLMLESHLFEGNQALSDNPADLLYGTSITDACLSWQDTKELLLWTNSYLSPTSIHSVQN